MKPKLSRQDDGTLVLVFPTVGLWREAPPAGALVRPGQRIGLVETLGELTALVAPEGAVGAVTEVGGDTARSRKPMEYGALMLRLDPSATTGGAQADEADAATASGLVFASSSSGRFYARPSPDKPPFVSAGDSVRVGDTVCVLEVMKTFNRIQYGGDSVPPEATVKRGGPRGRGRPRSRRPDPRARAVRVGSTA